MKCIKTKYYKECFYGFVDFNCQRRLSRLHRTAGFLLSRVLPFTILLAYGFLTMLPSGDLVSSLLLGQIEKECFSDHVLWKTRSGGCVNQSVRVHKALFHLFQRECSEG